MSEIKRFYVGGLSELIKEIDIETLFHKFGSVSSVEIHAKNQSLFGYFDLDTTPENVKKMVALLNGTKWKGSTLRIQEAHSDYIKKWEAKRTLPDREEVVLKKKKQKATFSSVPIENRSNWVIKDGFYLYKFKTRLHNRTKIIDPTHFQNHIRLRASNIDPSVMDLHFVVDDCPQALQNAGLLPTSDSFRKKCGIFTAEEIELAKLDSQKLRASKQEYEQELKLSEKSKKTFEQEWMITKEIQEENAVQQLIVNEVTHEDANAESAIEQVQPDGFVDFTDDEDVEPRQKGNPLPGVYDSD
jgi:RNA recognition motif-containing protein